MLPKFSLSLVFFLVYTGRLIDTKSILLLRGISKSVRAKLSHVLEPDED